jgi:hypothetical protein
MFARGWDQQSGWFKNEITKLEASMLGHQWTPRTSDIDETEKTAIRTAFELVNKRPATEADVINWYYNARIKPLE